MNTKLSQEELQTLKAKLPRGSITALAAACRCSIAKISGIFKGRTTDYAVIVAAQKMAEEYERQVSVMSEKAVNFITKLQ